MMISQRILGSDVALLPWHALFFLMMHMACSACLHAASAVVEPSGDCFAACGITHNSCTHETAPHGMLKKYLNKVQLGINSCNA